MMARPLQGNLPPIIVAGAVANKYRNGGGAWEKLSWAIGLRRLGFKVYFVEQIAPETCRDAAGALTDVAGSANLSWFRSVMDWFDLHDQAALIVTGSGQCFGMPWPHLLKVADTAELLVNLSGHLTYSPLLDRLRRKAYIDLDPGFTQCWHVDPGTPFRLDSHDYYFTIGENIGSPDCPIPTAGIRWRATRQPVVLQQWPVTSVGKLDRLTTVASWRGPFGPVSFGGRTFGLKVHEFRKYVTLPLRTRQAFEIALSIDPADDKDLQLLRNHHWRIVDPAAVASDQCAFQRYVQTSGAEFSVAQGIYVETNSGWFSDRTVRYLASGKPVLVQDTGFGRHYPVGTGLVPFRTLEEAIHGAERIARDYAAHCRAARSIAEEYFDSDKVLGRLIDEISRG